MSNDPNAPKLISLRDILTTPVAAVITMVVAIAAGMGLYYAKQYFISKFGDPSTQLFGLVMNLFYLVSVVLLPASLYLRIQSGNALSAQQYEIMNRFGLRHSLLHLALLVFIPALVWVGMVTDNPVIYNLPTFIINYRMVLAPVFVFISQVIVATFIYRSFVSAGISEKYAFFRLGSTILFLWYVVWIAALMMAAHYIHKV